MSEALGEQLASMDGEVPVAEPDPAERERLAAALEQARSGEVELRLASGVAQEQARAMAGRASQAQRAAANERQARAAADRRRRRSVPRRQRGPHAVARLAPAGLARLAVSLAAAGRRGMPPRRSAIAVEQQLGAGTRAGPHPVVEVETLRDARHRDEMARTEQRLASEALHERCREEWGMEPDALIAEYGPHLPVPPDAEEGSWPSTTVRRRRSALPRPSGRWPGIGTVNPLALEEFAALQERATFLAQQVEDLQKTRRELLGIVRDVDARVIEVMASALEDTAREFALVFPTLFPGGEGTARAHRAR